MREGDDRRSDLARGRPADAQSKAVWETPFVIRSSLPLSETAKTSPGVPELHNGGTTHYS